MTKEKEVSLTSLTEDRFRAILSEYLKRAEESGKIPVLTNVEYAAVGFDALGESVLLDVLEGRFEEKEKKSPPRKGWGKR